LIENSNQVFATTAARDRELQEAFVALPTFERESTTTLNRLDEFAKDTDPLVTQLRPAARELSPTLIDLSALAPDLKALFRDLDKVITASRTGFPAAERILEDLRPLLNQADPALRQVIPILEGLGAYQGELTAFFANTASATQAFDPGTRLHYLRTTNPLNPENLAAYPRRIGSNRPNAYQLPGGYRKLASGLEVYENRHCGRSVPTITTDPVPAATAAPALPGLPVPTVVPVPTVLPPEVTGVTQSLIDRINEFAFPVNNSAPAPACKKQAKFPVGGETTDFPHLRATGP
jgi:phospholipid/cholesterol/gamma-HCH transport system substrate-binding protein